MDFAAIRLIAAIIGGVNLCMFLFVFAAPFWRTSELSSGPNTMNNIWGYEGLWVECINFYQKNTQCNSIGSDRTDGTQPSKSNYYRYGIYAHLDSYRAMMIIALVTDIIAFSLSLIGMKCMKSIREGGVWKRWINIISGMCYFIAGIMTGAATSWYAAEISRQAYSPYYQTTRMNYSVGACLIMGWMFMATSLGLGCLLTCCTCYNRPVDEKNYRWTPPVAETEVTSQPVNPIMMPSDKASRYDEDHWEDDYASRHSSSRRSHRSHKSHKSRRSDRREKRSAWVDDYYREPNRYDDYPPAHDDGFV